MKHKKHLIAKLLITIASITIGLLILGCPTTDSDKSSTQSAEVTITVDTTAPFIVSNGIVANSGSIITITFSENIVFGTTDAANGTGFTVNTGTSSNSITTLNAVSKATISNTVLTLTVSTPLVVGQWTTVAIAANVIVDAANNGIVEVTETTKIITNYYLYTDATGETAQIGLQYVPAYTDTITVTEEATGGANNTSTYKVLTGKGGEAQATGGWKNSTTPVDLSAYNTLVFWAKAPTATSIKFSMMETKNTVAMTITDTWTEYSFPFSILGVTDATAVTAIKYELSNTSDVIHLDEVYVIQITPTDTIAPTISSIAAEGETHTITVTFNENIRFGHTGKGGMTIYNGSTIDRLRNNHDISDASISDAVLTLTLYIQLSSEEYIKIMFAENVIADIAGNPLASGDSPIKQVSRGVDSTPPSIKSISVRGKKILISFGEFITWNNKANPNLTAASSVNIATGLTKDTINNSITVSERGLGITDNSITIVLDTALVTGQWISITINDDVIIDLSGNLLPTVTRILQIE